MKAVRINAPGQVEICEIERQAWPQPLHQLVWQWVS